VLLATLWKDAPRAPKNDGRFDKKSFNALGPLFHTRPVTKSPVLCCTCVGI